MNPNNGSAASTPTTGVHSQQLSINRVSPWPHPRSMINGETITPVVNSTHWSSDETILLIRAWGEHRDEFAEIKRNHSVWNKVVEKLLSRGFFRTVDQCRNRWKFLESKFKVAKKEIVRSSAKPAWEFFNEMLAAKGEEYPRPAPPPIPSGVTAVTPLFAAGSASPAQNCPPSTGVPQMAHGVFDSSGGYADLRHRTAQGDNSASLLSSSSSSQIKLPSFRSAFAVAASHDSPVSGSVRISPLPTLSPPSYTALLLPPPPPPSHQIRDRLLHPLSASYSSQNQHRPPQLAPISNDMASSSRPVYHCHGTNHQQHSPTANINTSSLPSGDSKTAYSEHPKRPRSSDPDEVAYDGWPLKSPRVYHHRHHRQLAQSPSADMDIESVLRHYFDDEKSMPLSKPQLLAFLTNMSQLREKREARRTEEHREYQRIRVLEEQRYHEFQMQVMSMVSRHLAPGILDKPGDNGDQHCEPAVNNEVSNARSSQCNGVESPLSAQSLSPTAGRSNGNSSSGSNVSPRSPDPNYSTATDVASSAACVQAYTDGSGGSEDGDKSQGVRSRSYSHNDGSRNYQAWPGLELSPPAMLATRNTLKMVHVRQKQQKQSPSTRKHKKTKSEGKDRQ